ncbi:hypothetical protein D3273_22850 [Lichenibacterium minor]|uniref:Uncharacterized protein n=1 Tax=Lichenibacterium minor TaxID=2316528 RepID=A0A4V1RU23_9HYPH|nr:hypothetical protein [Lichenibacterium minor]RYC29654.1 hypothetical protein D3273_22850 [Lichenibacterium minor]
MSDVVDLEPSASPAESGADAVERPSIADIASRAIKVASERQADREAGREVPAELPDVSTAVPRERQGRPTAKPQAKPATSAPAETDARSAPPEASATAPAVEAPAGWSEEKKAGFARLLPDAQRLLLEHVKSQDDDYGQKSRNLQAQAQQAEPFIRAYVDHADFLNKQSAAIGAAPHEVMSNMVSILRAGTTGTPQERRQALGYVAYLFGINPNTLGA